MIGRGMHPLSSEDINRVERLERRVYRWEIFLDNGERIVSAFVATGPTGIIVPDDNADPTDPAHEENGSSHFYPWHRVSFVTSEWHVEEPKEPEQAHGRMNPYL